MLPLSRTKTKFQQVTSALQTYHLAFSNEPRYSALNRRREFMSQPAADFKPSHTRWTILALSLIHI